MVFGICPRCDHKINIGPEPDIGLRHNCESCREELVVVWLNPIELSMIDYEDYGKTEDDSFNETFQKIKKKKGEYYGNGKIQKGQ